MWAQACREEALGAKGAPRRGLSYEGVREETIPDRELYKYKGSLMG